MLDQEGLAEVAGVEPDEVEAVLLHLEVDRAGDDVARRQFHPFVVACHEARRIGVDAGQQQVRALAAQGLGDQKAALLRVVQAGRMELDEFHVADPAAGAPGHRDAVAGRGIGVAGIAVDLADPAGGEHDRHRRQRLDPLAVDIERIDAIAARRLAALQVARRDHVQRHPAFAQIDIRMAPDFGEQGIVDRLAGGVGGMGNPPHRVAALARQVQAERSVRIGRKTAPRGRPARRSPRRCFRR